ncbi:hypothetical protein [Curtobacterium sp. MCBD17_030]|uniref:hypothetical protein n=1 Tax=Curtobacterium sp. MCBD17_030 TaxID=2175649 RepID=UPI000D856308|nr:hypothetical protein [Curtobacterium sp. MCBD17_030]PYY32272.1 hypothetical protein DEI89_13680 [Curtobacterium sp. MCBD17_030]
MTDQTVPKAQPAATRSQWDSPLWDFILGAGILIFAASFVPVFSSESVVALSYFGPALMILAVGLNVVSAVVTVRRQVADGSFESDENKARDEKAMKRMKSPVKFAFFVSVFVAIIAANHTHSQAGVVAHWVAAALLTVDGLTAFITRLRNWHTR